MTHFLAWAHMYDTLPRKHLSTEPEQNTGELTNHHTKEDKLQEKCNITIISQILQLQQVPLKWQ